MQTIEKIESFEISFKKFETDELRSKIENVFSQDLVEYIERFNYTKIQFLNEHVSGFRCGDIIDDGNTLVTGGFDFTIRVWDLVNKNQKFVLHGHNSTVYCLTSTEDSKFIISGSTDASVRIWSIEQKIQIAILKGHRNVIYSICYIKAQSLIISGDYQGELIMWSFTSHTVLKRLKCPNGIFSLVFSNIKKNLITAQGKNIVFVNIKTEDASRILKGHKKAVWSLALNTSEKILVSGSSDHSIIIWDIINFSLVFQLCGHTGDVNSLSITLDSQFIVSGSSDETVRIWSMQTCSQIKEYSKHTSFVYSVIRNKTKFITLCEDSSIGELDIINQKFEVGWFLRPFKSNSMKLSSNSRFVSYGSKNEAAIWDIDIKADKHLFSAYKLTVRMVEISRDGQLAISCSEGSENNLILWDLKTNKKVSKLKGHSKSICCASFCNTQFIAASGSADGTIIMWNLNDYKPDFEFKSHTSSVFSIKFMNNLNLLVSAGSDQEIIIWDFSNQTQYALLRNHNSIIWKVLVTEDDQFIVSCDAYDGIRVWDVKKKSQVSIFSYIEEAAKWLKENNIQLYLVEKYLKA